MSTLAGRPAVLSAFVFVQAGWIMQSATDVVYDRV